MKSNVGELIAFLLRSKNRVSLPGMGAFIADYQPALINEDAFEIAPPTKNISFSKDETWNDQLLTNLIAEKENVSLEEAKEIVANVVLKVQEALNTGSPYTFEGFGSLSKDGLDYNFTIIEGINLLPDAFGLESLSIPKTSHHQSSTVFQKATTAPEQPITDHRNNVVSPQKNYQKAAGRKSRVGIIWSAAIGSIAIVATILYLFTDIFNPIPHSAPLAESHPEPQLLDSTSIDTSKTDSTEKANVEVVIDNQTEKKKALYYEEPKSSNTQETTFYIIAGSFTKQANAERLKTSLEKKGFKPEILTVDGPVYRVSMFSFTNKNRALEELSRLRDENKTMNIWLLGL